MSLTVALSLAAPVLAVAFLVLLHWKLASAARSATAALQLPPTAAPGAARHGFINQAEKMFFYTVLTCTIALISVFGASVLFTDSRSPLYEAGMNFAVAALSTVTAVYASFITWRYVRGYYRLSSALEKNVMREQTEFFAAAGYELAQKGIFIAPHAELIGKNPEERHVFARAGSTLVELAVTPRVSGTPLIRVVM